MKKIKKGKLKERIISHTIELVILMICSSVLYKLILKYPDWLYFTIAPPVAWVIGSFVEPFLLSKDMGLKRKILNTIFAGLGVYMLLAFIIGVVLNIDDWSWYSSLVAIDFELGVIFTSNSDDELYDEEDDLQHDTSDDVQYEVKYQ